KKKNKNKNSGLYHKNRDPKKDDPTTNEKKTPISPQKRPISTLVNSLKKGLIEHRTENGSERDKVPPDVRALLGYKAKNCGETENRLLPPPTKKRRMNEQSSHEHIAQPDLKMQFSNFDKSTAHHLSPMGHFWQKTPDPVKHWNVESVTHTGTTDRRSPNITVFTINKTQDTNNRQSAWDMLAQKSSFSELTLNFDQNENKSLEGKKKKINKLNSLYLENMDIEVSPLSSQKWSEQHKVSMKKIEHMYEPREEQTKFHKFISNSSTMPTFTKKFLQFAVGHDTRNGDHHFQSKMSETHVPKSNKVLLLYFLICYNSCYTNSLNNKKNGSIQWPMGQLSQQVANTINENEPFRKSPGRINNIQAEASSVQYEMSDHESDFSDDEPDNTKYVPLWAHSKNYMPTIWRQGKTDPEDVFGPIMQYCNLENIFCDFPQKPRYRSRTKSGDWGEDRVTQMEDDAYKKFMGWK
ncbi:hypothetical protein RFI_04839, partial [Reticulomyxa filosa]